MKFLVNLKKMSYLGKSFCDTSKRIQKLKICYHKRMRKEKRENTRERRTITLS